MSPGACIWFIANSGFNKLIFFTQIQMHNNPIYRWYPASTGLFTSPIEFIN